MIRFFLALILTTTLSISFGQHPIDQAIPLIEKEKYAEALPLLEEGLYSAAIDPALQAKGYFYRATCHLNLKETQADYLLKAVYDLAKVRNGQSEWAEKSKALIKTLHPILADSSSHYYNQIFLPETSDAGKGRMASKARRYFDAQVILMPSDYAAYYYRGACAEIMSDPLNSSRDFEQCIQFYKGNSPATPDTLIGQAYYQAASISFKYLQKTNEALQIIDEGINFTDIEKARCLEIKEQVTVEYWTMLMNGFNNQLESLEALKSTIEAGQSQVVDAQIQAFEKALDADPDNPMLWIAYGKIYEPSDPAKAEEFFLKAHHLNPRDAQAIESLIRVAKTLGDQKKIEAYEALKK